MKNFGLAPVKSEGEEVLFDELSGRFPDETPEVIPMVDILGPDSDHPAPTTKYICSCGSDHFKVYDSSGNYETSVRCVKCDGTWIVHSG